MRAMQRAINDLCCQITVEEIVGMLRGKSWTCDSKDNEALANELNESKMLHLKNNFHELFCDEIRGGLDGYSKVLERAMNQVAAASGVTEAIPAAASKAGGLDLGRLIYSAFYHKKIKRELPQFHIHASLHAAVRFDAARKFQANDFEDFRHACVAIPYYDVFCTERSLRHLVCTNPLCLDKVYHTKVIASDEEFLAHVDSLIAA